MIETRIGTRITGHTYVNATPMATDVLQPLFRSHTVGRPATEVVAGKTILVVLEGCRVTLYTDHGFNMWDADSHRVNRAQRNVVVIYTPVSFVRAGKRGVISLVSFAAKL